MKQKLQTIERQIDKAREAIMKVGPMRPGSLSLQTRRSKKAYGEYWHLSYTFKGRGRTEYIIDDCVKNVEKEVAAYKRFRELVDNLVELSIEASKLRIQMKKNELKQK